MFAFLQISRSETAQNAGRDFAEDGDVDTDWLDEERSRAGESMLEDDAGYDAESSYGDSNIEEEAVDAQWSISRADESFKKAEVNDNIMEMIARVKAGDYRDNDKVYLGRVSDETAAKIKEITGIDVRGFKVAIEARQVKHILNNHGESGKTNQTMAHDDVIARMEYALENPDNIRAAGKTTAYFYTKDGRNKTADTVLYEKFVGEKSYYVVQAVADTKKKTLFVVTAFIGDKGYKTGTPQFADAKSPDATSKNAAAEVPTESISQSASPVKEKLSVTRSAKEQDAILSQMRSILQNGGTAADLKQYVDTLDRQERAQAKKKPQGTNVQRRGDAASQIVRAAHDADMSVEEYLRENAELYETEDGWNKDARRALQMEENGRGVKYSISPALKDDLQKVLEGKFSSKNNEVYIGESSTFLTDTLKAKKLRVTMPVRKAYAAMVTEEEARRAGRYDSKLNYHGLGVDGLYDVLVASEEPVAAFAGTEDEKGNNRDDYIVLVTDKQGTDGNFVTVMEVDTQGYLQGKTISANKTITAYDRDSIKNDISAAAREGRLLHLDKKRSQSLFAGLPGSNSPGTMRSVDFENSIRHFWENVKWKKSGAKTFVAEPTGEQKTGMAYAFEKAQKKAEGKEKHSISGVHAVGADMEALARAKEMERGEKYSISKADIEALREIPNKSVNAFTSTDIKKTEKWAKKFYKELGTKSPFFRAWFGDWRAYDTEQVSVVSVPDANVREVVVPKGDFVVEDTGWQVHIGQQLEGETRHHTGGEHINVKALAVAAEILKKSVLFDTVVSDANKKKKSENTAFMHKLYTLIEYDGRVFVAKTTVEEFYNETTRGLSKRAYHLSAIEIEPAGGRLGEISSSPRMPSTDSIYTIADLFGFVKGNEEKFNPKPVSRVLLNEDGTPKVFYHGTDAKFTEFRPEEMAHREGSFFFAENREDAEAYGRNVLEVYLTGENLADYDNQPREFYQLRDKRAQVQYLEDRGYDGWYADMDSDGWGELSVFSPTQIKSATDNIGTFDGKNPDIRYSISSYETAQKPMLAKRDFRNRLMSLMSIPDGVKQKIGDAIEYYGEELIAKGRLEEGERRSFFNLLYSSGAMTLMADEYYRDIRSAVAKKRIYVSESVKSEFGDGWNDFRKKAFAAGVHLTHIEKYREIFDKY